MNHIVLDLKSNNLLPHESFPTSDDDKSPLLLKNEESTDSEKHHSEPYKITLDQLVNLIQEGEKRTFSEEVDKLEGYGGNNNANKN